MSNTIDKEQFELYEYARARMSQKKNLYYHFIAILIGSLFMFVANTWLQVFPETAWYIWAITIWIFLFILHFIKVFITHKFMGKEWEQNQINKLVKKQQEKIAQLQKQVDNQNQ